MRSSPANTLSLGPLYGGFKALVFGLLTANATYFLVARPGVEALDALSWLLLLALFELEANASERGIARRTERMCRMLRIAAGIAITAATLLYAYESQWADALNSALWIGVVLLLEAEVRYPQVVARYPSRFKATAWLLYACLAAIVAVWLVHEEWFDAYDAALWLVAFATIENDVLHMRHLVR